MGIEILSLLIAQCPVIGVFAWFLVTITKENVRHMQAMQKINQDQVKELTDRFQISLGIIVDKLGNRIDQIEGKLGGDLKEHDAHVVKIQNDSVEKIKNMINRQPGND